MFHRKSDFRLVVVVGAPLVVGLAAIACWGVQLTNCPNYYCTPTQACVGGTLGFDADGWDGCHDWLIMCTGTCGTCAGSVNTFRYCAAKEGANCGIQTVPPPAMSPCGAQTDHNCTKSAAPPNGPSGCCPTASPGTPTGGNCQISNCSA